MIRGPYWTGAVTPSGAAAPVVAPQPQRRATNWCSVTRTAIGGSSNTAAAPPRLRDTPPGRGRTRRSVSARAAPPRLGRRPWTASTRDAPAAHPVCVRSCAATTSAQAWRTEVGRRRLRRIRRILTQPAAQFGDLSPKTSHYRLQVLDRLPQRGVLGRELIGRTPIIRHHTMIRIPP